MSPTLLLLAYLAAPPNMALVPEGDFWMGRFRLWLVDEIGWQARDRMDDRPVHLVHLNAFYIDKNEVSNKDYARFVTETGHRRPFHWPKTDISTQRPKLPVYNVSWKDAAAYCSWADKRLPTEAEWEKAARGGYEKMAQPWGNGLQPENKPYSYYSSSSETTPEKMAHYGYPEGPTEVSSFPPNGYGLYDVIGNVWEWVADSYELHYYSISPRKNPKGPHEAPYKVYRGGSWSDRDERLLSVFYRNFTDPNTRASTIGFRCAQSVP